MELLASLPEFQEIPQPFLLNGLKHHIEMLRGVVRRCVASESGAEGLEGLARTVQVLGSSLMDMYHGGLTLPVIFSEVESQLKEQDAWEEANYRRWIQETGTYRELFLSDGSRWVLYPVDIDGRYIHLHPGRKSPHSSRIRGNALKTAVMAVASAQLREHCPRDVSILNQMRTTLLALSPMRAVEQGGGLDLAIRHLESE